MRVLVIEGNVDVARSLELMLTLQDFNVTLTDSGEEGVDLAKVYDFDVITTALRLPDLSGFEVLKQLRRAKVRTPVLILSALASIEDKVKGLGAGADDYMTKPFHKDELVARLRCLVRRSAGHVQAVIATGNLACNLDTRTVSVNCEPVHLTGKEYQMVELLSLRKGMTITKEMFLTSLYGGMDEPELKIIDVFMCKIRKKLNAAGSHPIETIWGRGYILRDAESHVSMTSEVASLADDPPTGWVGQNTHSARKRKAAIARNAAVPA